MGQIKLSIKLCNFKLRLMYILRAMGGIVSSAVIVAFLALDAFSSRRLVTVKTHSHISNVPSLPQSDNISSEVWEDEDISEIMESSSFSGALALEIYDSLFPTTPSADIPKGELKIVTTDLSKNPLGNKIYVKNNTQYKLSAEDYLTADEMTLSAPENISPEESEPLVLIYHSHGTEGYAEEGKLSYAKKDLPRTTNTDKNVVAVGRVLADALRAKGIPTYHCETMFDKGDYNNAYKNSRSGVEEILAQHPSIKYIFDLHRDALSDSDSTYKVLTYDESTPTAQLMLVVGTDSAGNDHKDWRENFAFAVDVQYLMTKRLSNIMRPICVKKSSFWQELSDRAILIEVGTCVNTLSEAKNSASLLGQTLAAYITAEQAEGMR